MLTQKINIVIAQLLELYKKIFHNDKKSLWNILISILIVQIIHKTCLLV